MTFLEDSFWDIPFLGARLNRIYGNGGHLITVPIGFVLIVGQFVFRFVIHRCFFCFVLCFF